MRVNNFANRIMLHMFNQHVVVLYPIGKMFTEVERTPFFGPA